MNTTRVFSVTKKNIKRNKWLTLSTILVSTIVFTLSSVFVSASILIQKSTDYYEQKAQVIVFFKKATTEEEIFAFRDVINNKELVEQIEYVSQDDALEIYREDFADNPDLISTVTADSLPASLEIRAKNIDSLLQVIDNINKAKETNASVDEVMYFKDVVDNMRTLSRIVKVGSAILITAMGLVTVSLIRVTIGFNIKLHQEEIQIMHLVGSPDKFIRTPFLLEGTLYGFLGGLISSLLIIVPWYTLIGYSKGTDFSFWVEQFLLDVKLPFLAQIDITFILIFVLLHLIVGSLFGFFSSLSAVRKYLRDE
ncbi:MAG: permease-like cell division protein FtsX [Candidatus Dojkabacteria bacterium]|jgi:cell division transport system permease protein|nr:permease-like cell division protein FtsX [Candidatus Dojkabacteria bacterium]